MTGRSSSWKRISGDIPLNELEKLQYRFNAWIERRRLPFETFPVDVEPYVPVLNIEALRHHFGEAIMRASPTRALCFDFILEQLPGIFPEKPRIFDLGCGVGSYSEFLNAALGYEDYQGCDIQERGSWKGMKKPGVTFSVANLGEDCIALKGATSVFTQSVLEHIQYDRSFLDLLTVEEPSEIQHVHFVPATCSFVEHRYHGYRRYGPGAISRLLDNPSVFDVRIYSMGNAITREMYWLQKGKLKNYQKSRAKIDIQYDQELSCVENLANNRKHIITKEAKEASFFALVFKQRLAPSS
ncbi:hypothetical protein [Roseibium album]|uniref:hypothetical protein n=1 Tax=Roseibium album TaxID=311410 RepID=UPI003BB06A0A